MAHQNVIVYISDTGGEVADLQDVVDGTEPELEWIGFLNGSEVSIRIRLAEESDDD